MPSPSRDRLTDAEALGLTRLALRVVGPSPVHATLEEHAAALASGASAPGGWACRPCLAECTGRAECDGWNE